MKLGVIYACAPNGVIGNAGRIPWHLPEDLAHFKTVTMCGTVIMGRKTWESLPKSVRPLPGRRNIVLTRQKGYEVAGADLAHSFEEALRMCGDDTVWAIGGADVIAKALHFADCIEVTEVDLVVDGDTFAPFRHLESEWFMVSREGHVSPEGVRYSFVRYVRVYP